MTDDLLKTALDAIDALIRSELDGDKPGRYERIAKICSKAHGIQQLFVTRVEELGRPDVGAMFMPRGDDDYPVDLSMGVPLPALRLAAEHRPPDGVEMLREMVATIQDINRRKETPTVIEDPIGDLERLLVIRSDMRGLTGFDNAYVIDEQIENALAKLKEKNDALVHTNLPRGHQGGGDGEGLQAHPVEADAGGEEGAGDTPDAGDQEGLDRSGGIVAEPPPLQ